MCDNGNKPVAKSRTLSSSSTGRITPALLDARRSRKNITKERRSESRVELRKELQPVKVSNAWKMEIENRILQIEEALADGKNADPLIEEFNRITGRHYDRSFFENYWRSIGLDEFVHKASQPVPKKVEGVTKEELAELVRRAMDFETYGPDTELYMEIFDAQVPMPNASNLIFWPEADPYDNMNEYNPTPEEIVEKALRWKQPRTDSQSEHT
jgi:hypothetical protein